MTDDVFELDARRGGGVGAGGAGSPLRRHRRDGGHGPRGRAGRRGGDPRRGGRGRGRDPGRRGRAGDRPAEARPRRAARCTSRRSSPTSRRSCGGGRRRGGRGRDAARPPRRPLPGASSSAGRRGRGPPRARGRRRLRGRRAPPARPAPHAVATTLSGYTGEGPVPPEPDLELVRLLARALDCPVLAEGRYGTRGRRARRLRRGRLGGGAWERRSRTRPRSRGGLRRCRGPRGAVRAAAPRCPRGAPAKGESLRAVLEDLVASLDPGAPLPVGAACWPSATGWRG